jgi:hypothetical protein
MNFCNAASSQRILEKYQKNPDTIQQKEALGKFFLFEFALRLGASILYTMIQSMKYTNPSLSISNLMRKELITKRFETAVNPLLLRSTFKLLLLFLEQRLWKEYSIPLPPTSSEDEKMESIYDKLSKEVDDKMESFHNKLMEKRFEEMDSIYKKTFPIVFEAIQKIGYDMLYEPGLVEKEDPNHIKCGGELMPQVGVDPHGRRAKKCVRCKRWIPVEDPKP